jgi:hypothetical protein
MCSEFAELHNLNLQSPSSNEVQGYSMYFKPRSPSIGGDPLYGCFMCSPTARLPRMPGLAGKLHVRSCSEYGLCTNALGGQVSTGGAASRPGRMRQIGATADRHRAAASAWLSAAVMVSRPAAKLIGVGRKPERYKTYCTAVHCATTSDDLVGCLVVWSWWR